MKVRFGASLALMCLASVAASAATPGIDLQAVSSSAVRRHLHELAAVYERYEPALKTKRERARFEAAAKRLAGTIHGPMPKWREWLLQQRLLRTLDDPHAELALTKLENQALPLRLRWVSNGVLVSPASKASPAPFPVNSQLVRIGGKTPGELLPRLEALFAGTPGWVVAQYGSGLRYAFELRWLGLIHQRRPVRITLRTPDGRVRHLRLALAPLSNIESRTGGRSGKPYFAWSLDKRHDVAWFTLDSMKLTGPYEHAVADFFAAAEKAHINRVAVDLRQNSGGETLAEAPFMQYLGVKKVQDYSSYTYFDPAHLPAEVRDLVRGLRRLGFAPAGYTIPDPPQPSATRIFRGHFFVVTGPGTFSSAMDFAADVKFNHLGVIVGRACGEVLTGGGDVKQFAHPPSGVPFQVPTRVFSWPGLPMNARVKPDVKIALTVKDVQDGVDPVRKWFDTHKGRGAVT